MVTMDALLEASDRELPMSSSHPCAQGKDLWTLITNDIDCCIDGAGGAPGRGGGVGRSDVSSRGPLSRLSARGGSWRKIHREKRGGDRTLGAIAVGKREGGQAPLWMPPHR